MQPWSLGFAGAHVGAGVHQLGNKPQMMENRALGSLGWVGEGLGLLTPESISGGRVPLPQVQGAELVLRSLGRNPLWELQQRELEPASDLPLVEDRDPQG